MAKKKKVVAKGKRKTAKKRTTKPKKVKVPPKEIVKIIIHCAATPDGKHFTVEDIDGWHKKRGFKRKSKYKDTFNKDLKSIGYHYVIYIDGSVHTGRHEKETGAHVKKHNVNTLGVSLIGSYNFTLAQWKTLAKKVKELEGKHSKATVHGHNEFAAKDCPGFKVKDWEAGGRKALKGHIFTPKAKAEANVPLPKKKPALAAGKKPAASVPLPTKKPAAT